MSHIGRTVKNVDISTRPINSQSRSLLKASLFLIEELIQLIENVAGSLQSGYADKDSLDLLMKHLRRNGPQVENISKDTLDRAFVIFRNASQDERLNLMTRLHLLQLIELRAKGWLDNGFNAYYETKQATNIELPQTQHQMDAMQPAFLSTSPTFGVNSAQQQQQQQLLLGPGEVIGNSGKFAKPTKIPGKAYCKDEVVIRNADSGRVMGIKGRRVHKIEQLSETVISFQRVNPGAKERLVQITGPSEEKINHAKQLIEETIRRNASPMRIEPIGGIHNAGCGSCSSLASSNSDEAVTLRTSNMGGSGGGNNGGGGGSSLSNRLSFNSAQNFMTVQQAAAQQQLISGNNTQLSHASATAIAAAAAAAAAKANRPNQQLMHSYSTNDASLGEYKYSVNVGQHVIKITGECCELVKVAKLLLDDYFSSAEFLASFEAGAAFDGTNSLLSPISTPTTPMLGGGPPQFVMGTPLHSVPTLGDSGISLNYLSTQLSNSGHDGEDDVFVESNASVTNPSSNGLARSRRSHFSRKDSESADPKQKTERARKEKETIRISYDMERLIQYAQSPLSWVLPNNWTMISEQFPSIVRNQDLKDESNRFDGDKYLELMKSSRIRTMGGDADETTVTDLDNQINE